MDLLSSLRKESGLKASSAILFNHESARRQEQFVSRKITLAAARAKLGQRPRLSLGNVGARVDWSSAHDVAEALHMIGASSLCDEYIVASGTLHSVRDFLSVAFQSVGLDWVDYTTYTDDHEEPVVSGDITRIAQRLAWRPTTTFEALVAGMVAADLRVLQSS